MTSSNARQLAIQIAGHLSKLEASPLAGGLRDRRVAALEPCRGCGQPVLRALAFVILSLLLQVPVRGQSSITEAAPPPPDKQDDPAVTIFDHSNTSRFWISGQTNAILQ